MNTEIEIHNFENKNVRIVGSNSDPWFTVKDICNILDLSNVTAVLKNIPEKWKGMRKISSTSGDQDMLVVNESGLYKLIMRSTKPIAQKFQEWVCEEVLPSIRKKGEFVLQEYKQKLEEKQSVLDKQQSLLNQQQSLLEEKQSALDQQQNVVVKQKSLLEEKDDRIKKLQRETQVVDGKNVVYLATSDDREKEGVFTVGKAIDLKNRLHVYNNNKLHNFKIVKYISCKSVKLMDVIEQIMLAKFNKYKILSDGDVFQLPSGKDVAFFIKSFDYLSKFCEDIEDGIELEERTEEEKQELIEEVKESLKEVKSEFNKKYREEHHDEILDREKSFRESNKEVLKIRNKEYAQNNPEKEKIRKAKYASEHQEERKEYMKQYREEKAAAISESRKKYNLEHKEEHEKRCACACGSIVSRQNLTSHLDTEIHKHFVETGETLQEQRKEETVECECGLTISKRGLNRHKKSKLHLQFENDGIKIKN
jgi:prophage antirepressor-like protein